MKRGIATLSLALALLPLAAAAQSAGAVNPLDDTQLLGMRLFNQSCRVCHIKPQATSPQYAPALSKSTLGGDAAAMRAFVSMGSARMPGFRNHFRPAEIDAIVAYLKTIEPPPQEAPPQEPARAEPAAPASPPQAAPSAPAPAGGAPREAD